MRKLITGFMTIALMGYAGGFGLTALAAEETHGAEAVPLTGVESVLTEADMAALLTELETEGYLAQNPAGQLEVTEEYVQEVQQNLGAGYTVTAEHNALIVRENGPLARGLFGGGETKVVYENNKVDLYMDGTLCFFLKAGMDVTEFLAALIPVPVLNTVIAKVINAAKGLIFAKDTGNGVVLTIHLIKGTYIPYFVTVAGQ